MRFSISERILPGVRVGIGFGGKRKARVWATERVTKHVRVTESTTLGKKKRRR